MLSLSEIEKFYPDNLKGFSRFLLREYLQHKILEIIFESKLSNQLCFLGGTCLRIVHNNGRFSEDLDFDNFELSAPAFQNISDNIRINLEKEGYQIEIRNTLGSTFHCHIRFPQLLFKEGLSGHAEEKILVQLDTEPQGFDFQPKSYIINKFDVFTTIFTTPVDILLSQKFYSIINRKRNKGRDFFDAVFLLQQTKPNYPYLNLKLGINNFRQLKEVVLAKCAAISMEEMAQDVKPFLFDPKEVKKVLLFPEYIKQVDL